MVYLREYSQLQIVTLLLLSITAQGLMLAGRPQDNKLDNQIDLFIEVCVSLYLYVLLILTDWWDTNVFRDECGWILVGLIIISLIANLLHFFTSMRVPLKRFLAKVKARFIKAKRGLAASKFKENSRLHDRDHNESSISSLTANSLHRNNPIQNNKQSWGTLDIRRAYNMLAV